MLTHSSSTRRSSPSSSAARRSTTSSIARTRSLHRAKRSTRPRRRYVCPFPPFLSSPLPHSSLFPLSSGFWTRPACCLCADVRPAAKLVLRDHVSAQARTRMSGNTRYIASRVCANGKGLSALRGSVGWLVSSRVREGGYVILTLRGGFAPGCRRCNCMRPCTRLDMPVLLGVLSVLLGTSREEYGEWSWVAFFVACGSAAYPACA